MNECIYTVLGEEMDGGEDAGSLQQGLQDAIPKQAQVIPKSSRAQEKPGVPQN